MLLHQRRQDITPHPHHQPSTTTNYFDSLPLSTSALSSADLNAHSYPQQPQRAFLDSRNLNFTGLSLDQSAAPSMPTFEYSNPAIRIQQSTPTPQSSYESAASESLTSAPFAAAGMVPQAWDQYSYRNKIAHRRGPSSSSVASSSPVSPYPRNQFNNVKSEQSPVGTYLSTADARRGFSNLPTPSDTPTSDSFTASGLQSTINNANLDNTMSAHYVMRDFLGGQEVAPDTPDFSHSGRHSVSSYNELEAPTTPHTVSGDEFDYRSNNQETLKAPHAIVPKFDRTLSDMMQDELFTPVTSTSMSTHTRQSSSGSLLSPYSGSRNLQERLLAANQARAASPSSRDASPYRQASAYAQAVPKYGNRSYPAAQLDGQQDSKPNARAMKSQMTKQGQEEAPKSVSPKDTILEYRETEADSKMPLFPEEEANEYETRYGGGEQTQHLSTNATSGNYNHPSSAQSYTDMASNNDGSWAIPHHPSTSSYSQSTTMNLQPQTSYNAFIPPAMQVPAGMNSLQFAPHGYRNINGMTAHEESPEFPAHLTSMESSMSEAAPTSSQNSITQPEPPQQKPGSSLADTGTYSCTYHGCALRFATPQKLQKHKREAHRSVTTHTTPGVGSGMTSAQLLARNSQAGPHRCDRINPTTGKPCATMFSRPYDLTRHEDTIHNNRKTKVRCALCVEEKTFSRNDALTRHMRVVHPEVDFPGKHRRRGTGSE